MLTFWYFSGNINFEHPWTLFYQSWSWCPYEWMYIRTCFDSKQWLKKNWGFGKLQLSWFLLIFNVKISYLHSKYPLDVSSHSDTSRIIPHVPSLNECGGRVIWINWVPCSTLSKLDLENLNKFKYFNTIIWNNIKYFKHFPGCLRRLKECDWRASIVFSFSRYTSATWSFVVNSFIFSFSSLVGSYTKLLISISRSSKT